MNARTVFLARLTGVFLLVLSLAMLALTSRARLPSIAYYPVPPKAHRWIGEMNEPRSFDTFIVMLQRDTPRA